jgi:hypothetical protein
LAGAAQLTELLEHQPDYLLQPPIWIEAEADVPVPRVADWDRDPQLAALRFRSCRLVHPGSNNPQLELADAPLHAKQQAVVRPAGVVHAIEVDDTGIHQSAQFQEMVPVAAIAREPRGIEAEHSADLPGAQGGDQAIEAGPFDGATRGATKIVVNHVDVGEPASTCDFDQLVLPPLAFQVRLDLLRGRLADIDDRLALQNGCRKESIMRCHR